MHSFPAELPHERLGILLPSKAKDLVPLLPNNRVTEARQRQTMLLAELPDFPHIVRPCIPSRLTRPKRESTFRQQFKFRLAVRHSSILS